MTIDSLRAIVMIVSHCVLPVILLLIPSLGARQTSSPLRYQTFMAGTIEAVVQEIRLVDISPGLPAHSSPERMPAGGARPDKVQKIFLEIRRVVKIELNHTGSRIHRKDVIEVTNQYLDQSPPFAVGDTIRARVRLVQPEERYDPKDPRRQWWFFPRGQEENALPPRLPFAGIKVVR